VLAKINELLSGEDFTPAEQQSLVQRLVTVLIDNDTIRAQANANTKKQFVESPDLSDAVTDAALGHPASHTTTADNSFIDDDVKIRLVRLLGNLGHENIRAPAVRSVFDIR
jgi:type I restriction enzyme R subunit